MADPKTETQAAEFESVADSEEAVIEQPASIIKWSVRDMLHVRGQPARVHQPEVGFLYPLYIDRWTFMPKAHAAKFLRDKGFQVRNEHKELVQPFDGARSTAVGQAIPRLEVGQTIAALHELTPEALYNRAAQYPGAGRLDDKAAPEHLINFILASERRLAAQKGIDTRGGQRAVSDGGVADFTPPTQQELDRILPPDMFAADAPAAVH